MRSASGPVLPLLEEGGFVSGEHISRTLGVSRTAVWKQITALRGAGYAIEAVPSRGYRLLSSPDLLDARSIAAHLESAGIGRKLVCLEQTRSTNADAFRLAEEGAVEGTVVIADAQIAGKGRRGRTWASPGGVNIYCSVILRPSIMPNAAPQLTFLSAVAVARAIEALTDVKAEIKWPNDVLAGGRKIAGLLNEMSAETDVINFVILGIGVNLNMSAGQFPADLRHPATSLLLESGAKVDRARFAATLMNELDRLYADFRASGFAPVRQEWRQRCNAAGRRVVVSEGGVDAVSGTFAGIDEDGALLVQTGEGRIERILSGDVRVI